MNTSITLVNLIDIILYSTSSSAQVWAALLALGATAFFIKIDKADKAMDDAFLNMAAILERIQSNVIAYCPATNVNRIFLNRDLLTAWSRKHEAILQGRVITLRQLNSPDGESLNKFLIYFRGYEEQLRLKKSINTKIKCFSSITFIALLSATFTNVKAAALTSNPNIWQIYWISNLTLLTIALLLLLLGLVQEPEKNPRLVTESIFDDTNC
jgi:hypothetical protein